MSRRCTPSDLDDDGFVYSHTQAMAMNPEAHQAFEALMRAIVPSIGIRTYELATLGAARGIPSPHCLLAHGRKALRAGALDEDQLEKVALDYETAGLSDADVAVMRFAEKLSTDAGGDDGCRLRGAARTGFQRPSDRGHRPRRGCAQLLQPHAAGAGRAGGGCARAEPAAHEGAAVAHRAAEQTPAQWWRSAFSRMRTPPNAAVSSALARRSQKWRVHFATASQPSTPRASASIDQREPDREVVIDDSGHAEQQHRDGDERDDQHPERMAGSSADALGQPRLSVRRGEASERARVDVRREEHQHRDHDGDQCVQRGARRGRS